MKNSSNALVLYFSLTDNTKRAANTVAEITGADIEILRLEEPYSDDYTEAAKRAEQEKDQQIIPELRPLNHQLNDYETIYLGFPTWWYQPPMVIHTFLLNINFLDKRLYRSLPVLVVQLRQVPKY
ncbi:twin-arginine translocation pathway signal [Lactiplantibacillus plantarum subsp. plantarum]|nr:flavodoxin [Lactiplantibacillus plantarum]WRM16259.1 flavodoxin [Lactiplantibacillus plantarum]SPX67766.1 twin-arginine translocation pathway signal [Lactiplantibacillus plantarum subsp. plantarum]